MSTNSGPDRPDGLKPLATALAEPFAFALVTWPAVISLLAPWPAGWGGSAHVALGLWLALMHLAAFGGGRGAAFGSLMLLLSGGVALATWGHPSPWILVWLPLLLIGLHAAQRLRLKGVQIELPDENSA